MLVSALGSLVFDCEVTSEDASTHGSAMAYVPEVDLVVQRLELLTRVTVPFARELRVYLQRRQAYAKGEDVHALAQYLASQGYDVCVRTALPGQGSDCFKALRHEFLVVRGAGEYEGMEFIVEPALRQHFAIPHPSSDYATVLAHVPDIFVGGSCRLAPLVQLLCALMADSFAAQGLALPPWRKEAAMLSKWLPMPNRTRDTHVTVPLADAPFTTADAVMAALDSGGGIGGDGGGTAAAAATPPAVLVEVIDVGRADSSNSNTTASDCGGVCSMGCSPVTAELLPPPSLSYSDAMAAAAAPGSGCGRFWAVHGFAPSGSMATSLPTSTAQPPAARVGDADVAAAATAATAASSVLPYGASIDGSVRGRSPGLLASKLQERRASDSGGSGAGSAFASAAGGAAGELIRTRAPAHPGEMAIRVVKLVGFALPSERQTAAAAAPPPSPLSPPLSRRGAAPPAEAAEAQRRCGGGLLPWRRAAPAPHARAA